MDSDKRRREYHIFYKGKMLDKDKIVIFTEIKKGGEKMRAKLIAPVTRDTGSTIPCAVRVSSIWLAHQEWLEHCNEVT